MLCRIASRCSGGRPFSSRYWMFLKFAPGASCRERPRRVGLSVSESYPSTWNDISRVVLGRWSKPDLWRNYDATLYIRAEPRSPPAIRTIGNNRVATQAHQEEVGIFAPEVMPGCPVGVRNNRRGIRQREILFAPLGIIRENKECRVGHLACYKRSSLAVVVHRQDHVIRIPHIIGASHVDER